MLSFLTKSRLLHKCFSSALASSIESLNNAARKRVYLEIYGCQMNFNDGEIVHGILREHGGYSKAESVEEADAVLLMTCAIRENAESKIWNRLDALRAIKQQRHGKLSIGILGCMAERLKQDLLEKSKVVDLVCGPDSYRSLPKLLADAESGQQGVDVLLSLEETYADVSPVRLDPQGFSAFVSIMRGCDNMCAFCIVPHTRGRERSRPVRSILEEVNDLVAQGVKEITLLGQNVNSYRDLSATEEECRSYPLSKGFRTVYRTKDLGLQFVDLLDRVSLAAPSVRIRFTSPHPKDFPNELLYLIRERPNICKSLHLPAQSGNTIVLDRMRRGYTRENYLELVENIRSIIPQVCFSTDLIAGFCGETEEQHADTLSLLRTVHYDMAYMYAYSMREKTMAHRRYEDDVPEAVKQRRLREIIDTFHEVLEQRNLEFIGTVQVGLIQGLSKKSDKELMARSDGNKSIIFDPAPLIAAGATLEGLMKGALVEFSIEAAHGLALRGRPLRVLENL